MARLFLSAALLLLICASSGTISSLVDESYSFEQFAAEFGNTYTYNEHVHRKSVFEKNLHRILEHNRKADVSHVLGINHFMDVESHEIPRGYDKSFHDSWKSGASESDAVLEKHRLDLPFSIDDVSTLPKSVDWRTHGVATPVKMQGMCGSCWAFASTAVLESHIALQTGVLYTLAVQELVSCVPNPRNCGGSGGCQGATGYLAMDFVASAGIQEEWQMGYTAHHGDSGNCTLTSSTLLRGGRPLLGRPVATIDGYSVLPTNDYKATMNAVAKTGPLVVAVACGNWHFYKGGVFTDTEENVFSYDIDHAVVLMGYGTDEETGEDYWLILNSWGPRW